MGGDGLDQRRPEKYTRLTNVTVFVVIAQNTGPASIDDVILSHGAVRHCLLGTFPSTTMLIMELAQHHYHHYQ